MYFFNTHTTATTGSHGYGPAAAGLSAAAATDTDGGSHVVDPGWFDTTAAGGPGATSPGRRLAVAELRVNNLATYRPG